MDVVTPPQLHATVRDLVFTHKSFYNIPSGQVEEPRDWERLAFVGEGVLFSTVSKLLYRLLPTYKAAALKRGRVKLMSKECLASVTDHLGWMKQIRCSEGDRPNVTQSVDNRAALTESYIGGVALQYGPVPAEEWAEDLLVIFLRRYLIEEGADIGVVIGMADKARAKRSAPSLPPPLPPSRKRSAEDLKPSLNKSDLVALSERNNAARMSDVDGEPMDCSMEIDAPSSGEERNFAGTGRGGGMSPPPQPAPATGAHFADPLPPAYSSAPPLSHLPPATTAVLSPPHTGVGIALANQQAQTVPGSYPSSILPQDIIPIYDPSNHTDGGYTYHHHRSSPYVPPPIATGSNLYPLPPSSTSSHSRLSTPTTSRSPAPITRPNIALMDKSQILKGCLAKLNERAKTRFEKPEWKMSSEGQGQLTVWTARLSLEGKRGVVCEAQGQSKQIAKELAAKAALEVLKWNDRPW
ncbi:hypothetical protein FRB95_013459 [Tulasnella sp. JGI-2019a]|nr:hypothetical protein FRB95_013459 [Tulasnella sp. JGI-2019a]